MSTTKLKAHRDQVVKAGIGTYLDVVKGLISAIDEHLSQDATETAQDDVKIAQVTSLNAKNTALTQTVTSLTAEREIHVSTIAGLQAKVKELEAQIKAVPTAK